MKTFNNKVSYLTIEATGVAKFTSKAGYGFGGFNSTSKPPPIMTEQVVGFNQNNKPIKALVSGYVINGRIIETYNQGESDVG